MGRCGRLILQADPDRVTMAWKIADRTGKIFIDHNMNRSGANIAAAYSMRPEPRAPVSTPLTWDEVAAGRVRAAGLPDRQRVGTVRSASATCSPACSPRRRTSRTRSRRWGSIAIDRRADPAATHVRGGHRGIEGPEPGRVHPQARLRGHAGAGAGRRRGTGQLVRDPQAPRDAAALRRATGAERRAAVVGRAEGAADREGRQAAGRADRGPSARVREVLRARSRRATTAPARSASSTTAGTSRSSGTTRRSRSSCTGGATRAWSSTS